MFPFCFKSRRNTENKIKKVIKIKKTRKFCFYQNVHCKNVTVKNQNLWKNKKVVDYLVA